MNNVDPRSVTFSAEGVAGTVRPLRTTRDVMFRGLVLRKVTEGLTARGGEWEEIAGRAIVEEYAQAVVVSSDVVGCELPPISASPSEHADGFERWIELEPNAIGVWLQAMDAADKPANAPELVPPAKLPDEKKGDLPIAVLKNESA